MKKFLGILAIAGVLVACDNSGSKTTTGDSTKMDSSKMTTTTETSTPATTMPATGDSSMKTKDSSGMSSKMTTTTTTKDSVKH